MNLCSPDLLTNAFLQCLVMFVTFHHLDVSSFSFLSYTTLYRRKCCDRNENLMLKWSVGNVCFKGSLSPKIFLNCLPLHVCTLLSLCGTRNSAIVTGPIPYNTLKKFLFRPEDINAQQVVSCYNCKIVSKVVVFIFENRTAGSFWGIISKSGFKVFTNTLR